MDLPDSGEGTVAAVVNKAVFSTNMKGGEFFNHLKDYLMFTQGYAQPREKKNYLQ
jgi:hypothetical protein